MTVFEAAKARFPEKPRRGHSSRCSVSQPGRPGRRAPAEAQKPTSASWPRLVKGDSR